MEEKVISSLDPARFMQSCDWSFKKPWKATVDVSTWVNVTIRTGGRLYLVLEYQDQVSKRSVAVDRCLSSSSESILLNGRVSFAGQGELQQLRMTLKFEKCDANSIRCEELSVRPIAKKAGQNKLRMAG